MADANIVNSSINPKKKKKQLYRDQPRRLSPKVEEVLVESEGVSSNVVPTTEPESLEKAELHSATIEVEPVIPAATEGNTTVIPNQAEAPAKHVEKIAAAEAGVQEEKGKTPKGLVNQASTIKISKEAKKKFDAIRMATGAPAAYQLLELMMDAYYEQHLTPAQKQVVDVTSLV